MCTKAGLYQTAIDEMKYEFRKEDEPNHGKELFYAAMMNNDIRAMVHNSIDAMIIDLESAKTAKLDDTELAADSF